MMDAEIKRKNRPKLSPEEEKVLVEERQTQILKKLDQLEALGIETMTEEKKAQIKELLKNGDSEQL